MQTVAFYAAILLFPVSATLGAIEGEMIGEPFAWVLLALIWGWYGYMLLFCQDRTNL